MPSLSQSDQDLNEGRSSQPHFPPVPYGELSRGPGACLHATAWFTRMPVLRLSLLQTVQTAPVHARREPSLMPSRWQWDRTALRAAPRS